MNQKRLQKIFPALGTVNTIALYGNYAPETAEQVKKRVLELHARFSFLNRKAIFSESMSRRASNR